MVAWTFDFIALFVGFCVGMLAGGILFGIMEMRDGGAWSIGFFEGCDKRALINYLENEKKETAEKVITVYHENCQRRTSNEHKAR